MGRRSVACAHASCIQVSVLACQAVHSLYVTLLSVVWHFDQLANAHLLDDLFLIDLRVLALKVMTGERKLCLRQ